MRIGSYLSSVRLSKGNLGKVPLLYEKNRTPHISLYPEVVKSEPLKFSAYSGFSIEKMLSYLFGISQNFPETAPFVQKSLTVIHPISSGIASKSHMYPKFKASADILASHSPDMLKDFIRKSAAAYKILYHGNRRHPHHIGFCHKL